MRAMKIIPHFFAAVTFLFTPSAFAATLDFDGLDASGTQTVPLASFSEDGFSFNLSSSGANNGPAIFDTTCLGAACNGDTDLKPAVQGENGVSGNVLILQSNGGGGVPNDDGNGGSITLENTGPAFQFTGASAIDDGMFTFFSIIMGVETQLGQISLTSENETGMTTFASAALIKIGDAIRIEYSGSGGVDSLVVATVPVPAALPLFLSALVALAMVGRRRKMEVT